jgi:hypothetical protein
MEKYPPYQAIFSRISYGESQLLDKAFYEEEVRRLCLPFEQQVFFFALTLSCIIFGNISSVDYVRASSEYGASIWSFCSLRGL